MLSVKYPTHPPSSCSNSFFFNNAEGADNPRPRHVWPPAKFLAPRGSQIIADKIHFHFVRIFFLEIIERSAFFRFGFWEFYEIDWQIFFYFFIHDCLRFLYFFQCELPRERKVKPRPLRRYVRPHLPHLRPQ